MEVSQPDVSKIMRGRFDGFSLESLLSFVRTLGRDYTRSNFPSLTTRITIGAEDC
jgi:predicted XRE-type DNA-binding protein